MKFFAKYGIENLYFFCDFYVNKANSKLFFSIGSVDKSALLNPSSVTKIPLYVSWRTGPPFSNDMSILLNSFHLI